MSSDILHNVWLFAALSDDQPDVISTKFAAGDIYGLEEWCWPGYRRMRRFHLGCKIRVVIDIPFRYPVYIADMGRLVGASCRGTEEFEDG